MNIHNKIHYIYIVFEWFVEFVVACVLVFLFLVGGDGGGGGSDGGSCEGAAAAALTKYWIRCVHRFRLHGFGCVICWPTSIHMRPSDLLSAIRCNKTTWKPQAFRISSHFYICIIHVVVKFWCVHHFVRQFKFNMDATYKFQCWNRITGILLLPFTTDHHSSNDNLSWKCMSCNYHWQFARDFVGLSDIFIIIEFSWEIETEC